jgi:hypothetical protein
MQARVTLVKFLQRRIRHCWAAIIVTSYRHFFNHHHLLLLRCLLRNDFGSGLHTAVAERAAATLRNGCSVCRHIVLGGVTGYMAANEGDIGPCA